MTTPTLSERLLTRMATTYQTDGLLNEAAAALDARNSELDRLRDECARLRADAERWRMLTRTASLGFDGAPSWNAVMRLPVFSADDQTIGALVDSIIKWDAELKSAAMKGQP